MFMTQQRKACTNIARCPDVISASRHLAVLFNLFRILGLGCDCKEHKITLTLSNCLDLVYYRPFLAIHYSSY